MKEKKQNQNLFQFKVRLLLIENYAMTQIINIYKLLMVWKKMKKIGANHQLRSIIVK